MHHTRAEVDATVRRFITRVREHMPVDEVWVYGSYANGAPHEYSDIDVAVLSPAFAEDYWHGMKLLSHARVPDAITIEAIGFPTALRSCPRGSFLEEILRSGYQMDV